MGTSARVFLTTPHKIYHAAIIELLTDNRTDFTDNLFASRDRQPSFVFINACIIGQNTATRYPFAHLYFGRQSSDYLIKSFTGRV